MASVDTTSSQDIKDTMTIDHRTNRSIPTFILQHLIKPFNTRLIQPKKGLPGGSNQLEVHRKAKKRCDVQERVVEGIYIYDMLPKHQLAQNGSARKKKRKRLYYFAGGAWRMPPSTEHWALCVEFVKQLPDTTVSIVSYPLAPNSPAPKAIPHLMEMYKCIMQDAQGVGEDVIFVGDSAGGNVILCLTSAALAEDEKAPCPTTLMAISPACDLSNQNPEMATTEKHDPLLRTWFTGESATKWRDSWDAEDPRVTPLAADVSALVRRGVRVHGIVGSYDILSPDAVLFRDKCKAAGVRGEWLHWEKQMHCFALAWMYRLPESVAAKDWIVDVLRRS
ncbi:hypothetical protein LTR37_009225 [Vermiconidia calcicola]|uniref:Uncharacterized protein n=1 Tax=Vermiconidia calcicola TaxID=1690605 RepID=A0ACC3N8G8_9PEZI|nr:hypothetical protein LTR37_009225 [Vermiconidia calcicola]